MSRRIGGRKNVEYYLSLPYPISLSYREEDGGAYWLAEVPDLPGCMADGSSPDEAVSHLDDAKKSWIQAHLDDGFEVPEPSGSQGFSGKLLLRLPKSLHRSLAQEAQRENVSLNQHIVSVLSRRNLPESTLNRLLAHVDATKETTEAILQRLLTMIPYRREFIYREHGYGDYSTGEQGDYPMPSSSVSSASLPEKADTRHDLMLTESQMAVFKHLLANCRFEEAWNVPTVEHLPAPKTTELQ